jgi:hypothetical protein
MHPMPLKRAQFFITDFKVRTARFVRSAIVPLLKKNLNPRQLSPPDFRSLTSGGEDASSWLSTYAYVDPPTLILHTHTPHPPSFCIAASFLCRIVLQLLFCAACLIARPSLNLLL